MLAWGLAGGDPGARLLPSCSQHLRETFSCVLQVYNSNKDNQSEGSKYISVYVYISLSKPSEK